jgi:hypothetical protein
MMTGVTSNVSGLLGRAVRPLLWLGALGFALSAICVGIATGNGLIIPPEGDLTKVIAFDLALGLYVITIAFILPLARFSRAGQRLWIGLSIGMTLYAYGMETIQQLRGVDPRFTHVGGPVDAVVGTVFGLDALGLIVMFSILAVKLVRRGTGGTDGVVLLGLRYAGTATMLAFAAGIWMSVNQGRYTGAAGNILSLHAFGFHALQAIPLVALLFSRSATSDREARPWVHAAGATWLIACLGIAWQTAAGRPVTELSPAMLTTLVALCGWTLTAVRAIQAWRATRLSPDLRPATSAG